MSRDVSRRSFLRSAAISPLVGVAGRAAARREATAFDPTRHGFGFVNWAPDSGRFPEHDHRTVTPDEVARRIRERWGGSFAQSLEVDVESLPDSLVGAIARQLYVSTMQASAGNGHCWGMSYTAQRYLERPNEIPAGRAHASEFTHPMAPVSNARYHPVSDDIDDYQLLQVLDADAWVGRRAILHPGWIALKRQVRNVARAVEAFGTATVTLVDPADRSSHVVLAYDVTERSGRTEFAVYDPNRPASRYRVDGLKRIVVTHGADGAEMQPYGHFKTFFYNDRERLVAARGEAAPAPAFDLPASTLRDELLSVAVFLLDSADARMTVVDPAGSPVRRDWAPFASRDASRYHQMRYRYNPEAGRYHVVLTGSAASDVTLSVHAADREGELVRAERTTFLEAGESERFAVEVPESGVDSGSVERVESLPNWVLAAGGVVVGALGVGGAVAASRRL